MIAQSKIIQNVHDGSDRSSKADLRRIRSLIAHQVKIITDIGMLPIITTHPNGAVTIVAKLNEGLDESAINASDAIEAAFGDLCDGQDC